MDTKKPPRLALGAVHTHTSDEDWLKILPYWSTVFSHTGTPGAELCHLILCGRIFSRHPERPGECRSNVTSLPARSPEWTVWSLENFTYCSDGPCSDRRWSTVSFSGRGGCIWNDRIWMLATCNEGEGSENRTWDSARIAQMRDRYGVECRSAMERHQLLWAMSCVIHRLNAIFTLGGMYPFRQAWNKGIHYIYPPSQREAGPGDLFTHFGYFEPPVRTITPIGYTPNHERIFVAYYMNTLCIIMEYLNYWLISLDSIVLLFSAQM